MHQLQALIEKHRPDVIGLQEIKVQNDLFPYEDIRDLGYQSLVHGQKGHYGVALLTRVPPDSSQLGYPTDLTDAQRRMVGCTLAYNGRPLHIYNGYFPQEKVELIPKNSPISASFTLI